MCGNAHCTLSLRSRLLRTVAFNLGLFLVPITCYHLTGFIALWGAYQGYWPLYLTVY